MIENRPVEKVDFSGLENFRGKGGPDRYRELVVMSNHLHCDKEYKQRQDIRRYCRWIVIATLLAAGISLGWNKKEQILAKVNPIFPQTAHVAEKQAQPQAERYRVP